MLRWSSFGEEDPPQNAKKQALARREGNVSSLLLSLSLLWDNHAMQSVDIEAKSHAHF